MSTRKLIILTTIFIIFFCAWCRSIIRNDDKYNSLFKNHIRFSGKIVSLNVSGNHAYGIIRIKVEKTNTNAFTDSIHSAVFPYKIKEGYAEFYGYVPVTTKTGYDILLDSDKRILEIYDHEKNISTSGVNVSFESDNIMFVNRHTMFK
ncbi:hypothetical protein [Chitinophaga flava]|uniref:Uncharacterized protein n=1 Tax=Chitinophaga flava TaxID=2259036 RepID=A0A365Y5K0_9BACT|nr:hypothetical protein [Chitinophaga flava]RBL93165.1 hypothetical protein DF182_11500 [Chitinophaga flava]